MTKIFSILFLLLLPITFLYTEETEEDFYLSRILNQRHSGYSFDKEKPISFDTFIKLSEATKLTPSSYYETEGELLPPKNRNPLETNFFCETWGLGMTPDLTV